VRDIRASAEVRALAGAEKLRDMQGDALVRYKCWPCGRTGRTAEPTSVIVLGHPVFHAIQLAHAGCADRQIIEVGAAWVSAVGVDLTHRPHTSRPRNRAAVSLPGRNPGQGDTRHRVPGMKSTRLTRRLAGTVTRCGGTAAKSRHPVGAERKVGNDE
jgi:hypothetical protein